MDQLLWYLFAGTRGGLNRLRLVELIHERPYNAHQLSELTGLDYRTTRHHLGVLIRHHSLVNPAPDSYGSLYFLSGLVQAEWATVVEIKRHLASASGASKGRGVGTRRARVTSMRAQGTGTNESGTDSGKPP